MADTQTLTVFAPFEALAEALLPHFDAAGDGSHDIAHIARVFRNAMRIQALEGGYARVLAAAVLLQEWIEERRNRRIPATQLD